MLHFIKNPMVCATLSSSRTLIINPPWQLIGFVILLVCILFCYAKLYDKLEKIEKQLKSEDKADKGSAAKNQEPKD